MQRELRVSLIQGDTRWHDPEGNRRYYAELARPLRGRTDLVVLPETFTTGFTNQYGAEAEGMDGPSPPWLAAMADEVGAVVTGSAVIREGDRCRNRLLLARPGGGPMEQYDKRHLFRMASEHDHFAGGDRRVITEVGGWRLCPLICYDLRFPVWSRNRAPGGGLAYDLLLYVANWPAARRHAWRTLLRARAIENLAYCVGVNRVGTDGNGIVYAGDSAALDFLGMPLVECGAQAQVVTVTLDGEALAAHRARFPAHLDGDDFTLA